METSQLKQFTFLVKENKGVALEKIIEQILSSDLYYFFEYLDMPNMKELNKSENKNKHYNTMKLFSSNDYQTYITQKASYIDLSPALINKLKLLSIVDLAKDNKAMNYEFLMKKLDIKTEFELEQVLFEAFSKGLVQGQADPMKKKIMITSLKGRNNSSEDAKNEAKIESWIDNLNNIDQYIDTQIHDLEQENKKYQNMFQPTKV